jgi:PmbA protein
MRDLKPVALEGLKSLVGEGADKAQVTLNLTEKHEMNVDQGEFSLLRTTFDTWCNLTAIKDGRKGSSLINKSDSESVGRAANEALAIARASRPDDANDVAEFQPAAQFSKGADSPDLDRMHYRLRELLTEVATKYPKAILRQVILDFSHTTSYVVNSNGVDYVARQGVYHFMTMFSSRDGDRVSSFNYTGFSMADLEKRLLECGSLDTLLKQSAEQIVTSPLQGKFVGDVIVTPDCIETILGFLTDSITDRPIISGTSIYKDSVGQIVTTPLLTLHSKPVSDEIREGYFVTPDGYAAKNSTLVEKGVLKGLLLSLYGSKKTGKPRAVNAGGAFVVDPGTTRYEEMVRSVKMGLLMTRFSGGQPSENGDFSGSPRTAISSRTARSSTP